MIDHIYISVTNVEKSLAFYAEALKPLGWSLSGNYDAAGEVFARVVQDVVSADRAHEVQLLRVVHAGDLGPVKFGQLHGVHARTAAAVDQHLLPGLDPSLVPDAPATRWPPPEVAPRPARRPGRPESAPAICGTHTYSANPPI